MKKLLIASAVAAAVMAPAAQAKVSVSGQVNQAAILSGTDIDDVTIVDNNTSGSRFRFKAAKEFGGLKAGMNYEIQLQDNSGTNLKDSLGSSAGTANGGGEVRVSNVWLSGDFGKIGIGKGSEAADGTFEGYGALGHYLGGDLAWLAINGSLGANAVQYRANDAAGRANRIRYDSPKFGGASLALSLSNGDATSAALKYGGKIGGGKLVARIGLKDSDSVDNTSGSIAYVAPFGLGVSYSFSDKNDVKGNWVAVAYNFGKVVLQYGAGESDASNGGDNEFSVLGVNYKPTKGVEIYLNYADGDNADGTGGDATYLGSRVKF